MADYNGNLTLTERPETGTWIWYNPVGVAFDEYDIGVDPADTPLVFGFTPKAVGAAANADYFFSIAAAGTIANGATFEVNGTEFVAGTVKTATTFLDTTTAQLLQAMQSLADCIAKDATLGRFYSVQVFPSGLFLALRITAKQPGTAFDLTVSFSGFTGTNPSINTLGSDTDRAMQYQKYEYGAWCRVYALIDDAERTTDNFPGPIVPADRDKFVEIAYLAASWGGQDVFRFDIGKWLSPYCQCALPHRTFTGYQHRPLAMLPYYVRYGERFNGGYLKTGSGADDYQPENAADDITDTYLADWVTGEGETRFAIGVALPLNEIPAPFTSYWQQMGAFAGNNVYVGNLLALTANPEWKLRRRGTFYELIAFVLWNDNRYAASLPCRIRTRFTLMDGSTTDTLSSVASVSTNGVHICDIGNGKIQLTAVEAAGTRVRFFRTSLEVERGTGNWIELWGYGFELDLNYEPNRYVKLVWRNKFNAFDQFEFESWETMEAPREAQTFVRSLPLAPGDSIATHIRATALADAQVRHTITSGWVNEEHMEYLRGCLNNPEVWVMASTEYIAVEVLDTDWVVETYQQQYRVTLTYRHSHPENNKVG